MEKYVKIVVRTIIFLIAILFLCVGIFLTFSGIFYPNDQMLFIGVFVVGIGILIIFIGIFVIPNLKNIKHLVYATILYNFLRTIFVFSLSVFFLFQYIELYILIRRPPGVQYTLLNDFYVILIIICFLLFGIIELICLYMLKFKSSYRGMVINIRLIYIHLIIYLFGIAFLWRFIFVLPFFFGMILLSSLFLTLLKKNENSLRKYLID